MPDEDRDIPSIQSHVLPTGNGYPEANEHPVHATTGNSSTPGATTGNVFFNPQTNFRIYAKGPGPDDDFY